MPMPDAKKLFETLVHEHADMLIVYLRSAIGNVTEVDDVFQETMIVAWRRLDDFDHTRPFAPWLRGIARKLVLAHNRKRARNLCTPTIMDQLETRLDQLTTRHGDTWEEKLEVLHGCVRSLPDDYRTVVTQRYFKQQSIQQVSDLLELSSAAVKKRLQRARSLVLDCIDSKLASPEYRT
jgi:RNA polymerase sigma-70 factor